MASYRILDLDARDAAQHPTVIEELILGRLDVARIQGVLSAEHRAAIVDRLNRRDPYLKRINRSDDERPPFTIPRTLLASRSQDLGDYLSDAQGFAESRPRLEAGGPDVAQRLREVFGTLNRIGPVEIPAHQDGRPYTPYTIRTLAEGDALAVHSGVDLQMKPWQCEWLRSFVVHEQQLSFFITLQAPQGGGGLQLYDLRWEQTDGQERVHGMPVTFIAPSLESDLLPCRDGELILFNGGRIYHSVSAVEGPVERITLGGFLGFDRGGRCVYQWS